MILVTGALVLAILAGWKVGASMVANLELQEDMHDLVSQTGNYVRYTPPKSDDEFRDAVIRKAKEHDIDLGPNQVTVQHPGSGANATTYLAADYSVPVNLPRYTLVLHFTPSSAKSAF